MFQVVCLGKGWSQDVFPLRCLSSVDKEDSMNVCNRSASACAQCYWEWYGAYCDRAPLQRALCPRVQQATSSLQQCVVLCWKSSLWSTAVGVSAVTYLETLMQKDYLTCSVRSRHISSFGASNHLPKGFSDGICRTRRATQDGCLIKRASKLRREGSIHADEIELNQRE
jgi:hypothetical protein